MAKVTIQDFPGIPFGVLVLQERAERHSAPRRAHVVAKAFADVRPRTGFGQGIMALIERD